MSFRVGSFLKKGRSRSSGGRRNSVVLRRGVVQRGQGVGVVIDRVESLESF